MVMADDETTVRGTVETEVNDFADAFNVAAEVGDRAELSPADDPANISSEPPPEPVEVPVVEPVAEVPVVTPEEPVQQPGESDEKYEQRYKTLQGILRHEKELWEVERLRLQTELEEAKKVTPKEPETTPQTFIDSLTDEEKAALKEYDEDFDVVSKMEGKKREIELNKLRKEVQGFIENLKTEISTQLAPATALVAETLVEREKQSEESHFNAIKTNHADFEKYRDDGSILKWIDAKPGYLKRSMTETYSKGTAEEVVELITDFKVENNIQPSPDTTNVVNMKTRKAEKKLAMTAVTTRRGAVNASMAVANDYEGAFDEAMNKSGG
jgi:predicted secreted Zn-dependent protease